LKEFTELFHERQNKEEVLIEVLINVILQIFVSKLQRPSLHHRIAQTRVKMIKIVRKKKNSVRTHRIKSAESI
jgi:hypothetical protein